MPASSEFPRVYARCLNTVCGSSAAWSNRRCTDVPRGWHARLREVSPACQPAGQSDDRDMDSGQRDLLPMATGRVPGFIWWLRAVSRKKSGGCRTAGSFATRRCYCRGRGTRANCPRAPIISFAVSAIAAVNVASLPARPRGISAVDVSPAVEELLMQAKRRGTVVEPVLARPNLLATVNDLLEGWATREAQANAEGRSASAG